MKQISGLLERFKKLIDLDKENKKTISDAIKRHTNEEIKTKDILINQKTLHIKQNPYVKREILSKKTKILADLKNSLINLVIEDIK